MGKKLLVALAMEGKFASEGLQAIDGDDDMLTAMARELWRTKGSGNLPIPSGEASSSCGPRPQQWSMQNMTTGTSSQ